MSTTWLTRFGMALSLSLMASVGMAAFSTDSAAACPGDDDPPKSFFCPGDDDPPKSFFCPGDDDHPKK